MDKHLRESVLEQIHCCEISGFRRETNENCAILGYYAACSFLFLTDFSGCPETSVRNYHCSWVTTQKSAVLNCIATKSHHMTNGKVNILFFLFQYIFPFKSCIILYNDQQMHNYFTTYHTPTCSGTIVSSSGRL